MFFFTVAGVKAQNSDVYEVSMAFRSAECDLAIQTQVTSEKIRYVSDIKFAWVVFEKIRSVFFRLS